MQYILGKQLYLVKTNHCISGKQLYLVKTHNYISGEQLYLRKTVISRENRQSHLVQTGNYISGKQLHLGKTITSRENNYVSGKQSIIYIGKTNTLKSRKQLYLVINVIVFTRNHCFLQTYSEFSTDLFIVFY